MVLPTNSALLNEANETRSSLQGPKPPDPDLFFVE